MVSLNYENTRNKITNMDDRNDYNSIPEQPKKVEITRLEVINHAKNDKKVGRILTMYKELGDFENIELSFQDGGKTLKIFLNS